MASLKYITAIFHTNFLLTAELFICFYYSNNRKKTKFSSSIHTLFREDSDMKYLDQFKESLIPRPPDIMLRCLRSLFPKLSRYGTRTSLISLRLLRFRAKTMHQKKKNDRGCGANVTPTWNRNWVNESINKHIKGGGIKPTPSSRVPLW